MSIGKRIRRIRKSKKISQETLAEQVNVSTGYISQLERGTKQIALPLLKKISVALNTDIGLLVSDNVFQPDTPINCMIGAMVADWSEEEIEILSAHLSLYNERRKKKLKQ